MKRANVSRRALLAVVSCAGFACHEREQPPAAAAPLVSLALSAVSETGSPAPAADSAAATGSVSAPVGAVPAGANSAPLLACPMDAVPILGASFWVGSPGKHGPDDEHPRFSAQLADFCLQRTEVTVKQYQVCVDAGACASAKGVNLTCNAERNGRENYPINCVNWQQAAAYCDSVQGRLPTEVEWEYAARGGAEYRKWSVAAGPLDELVCWKRATSCAVGSYPAGAFGLFDMTGNVWEWTASRYGAYPYGDSENPNRVYRGGSWSRRFEKWLSPTLRNRANERHSGSHLGFRCVLPRLGEAKSLEPTLQVEGVECSEGNLWNGARCTRSDAPLCRPGYHVARGQGCVPDTLGISTQVLAALKPEDVGFSRQSEYDRDCQTNQPGRPRAYRLTGADHPSRNSAGSARSCKNRDVGVGWNSVCCPL